MSKVCIIVVSLFLLQINSALILKEVKIVDVLNSGINNNQAAANEKTTSNSTLPSLWAELVREEISPRFNKGPNAMMCDYKVEFESIPFQSILDSLRSAHSHEARLESLRQITGWTVEFITQIRNALFSGTGAISTAVGNFTKNQIESIVHATTEVASYLFKVFDIDRQEQLDQWNVDFKQSLNELFSQFICD